MRPADGPVVVILEETSAYQRLLLAEMRGELEARGIPVLLHLWGARDTVPPASLERLLRHNPVRGIAAIQFTNADNRNQLDELIAGLPRIPTVYVGRTSPTPWGRSVRADNAGGMRLIAEHLVTERDIRRILLVRGLPEQIDAQEREVALRIALQELGAPLGDDMVVDGLFQREQTYRAVWTALRRGRPFDAIVAANDQSALGAIDAVQAFGLSVPGDLLVTGFDDEETATRTRPSLTTVNQNLAAQGAAAARLLLELGDGLDACDVRVPVRLQVRESTGPAEPEADDTDPETAAQVASANLRSEVTKLDTMIALSRAFMGCSTVEDMIGQLAACLPRLEISRTFLVLRDTVAEPDAGPPLGTLALAHFDGALVDASRERPFDLSRLLPDHLHRELRRGTLTVQQLSLGDVELGYLLTDRPAERHDLFNEVLRLDLIRTMQGLRTQQLVAEQARLIDHLRSLTPSPR